MPISMHIEGYYRITIDEDDMRGTYIEAYRVLDHWRRGLLTLTARVNM